MKIAILGRFRVASANGVDRTIEGHIRHFAAAGHRVTLLTSETPDAEAATELRELGVLTVQLPLSFLLASIQFWSLRKNFDILWMHSVFTIRNWVAFLTLGCPWITTPNGGYSPGQIAYKRPHVKSFALRLVERRMLEKALFVHVLSKNERDQVRISAPSATCVIAPNGCEPPPKRHSNQISRPIRFLFIGRLAWMHKGLDLFLNALKRVNTSADWQFEIVGPGSLAEIKKLKDICASSTIEDRVIFHGPLYGAEKDDIVNRCNIFIHTSRWEGMPFSVIEALCQGLPVIVTPGTNMTDLVAKHDAGWVTNENDITSAISNALEASSSVLASKGTNAQNLVRAELDWKTITDTLLYEADRILKNAR